MTITRSGLFPDKVTRAEAARIAHEYLLNILHEKDEDDISAAYVLKDLYDCHVCVGHIAQVYAKGIMAAAGGDHFGLRETLEPDELELIFQRLTDRTKRLKVEAAGKEVCRIAPEDIAKLRTCVIIDVRSEQSYCEGHMADAVNIPLEKLYINPMQAAESPAANLVFICDKGAKASLAAYLAVKAGFVNVYYSGYESPV